MLIIIFCIFCIINLLISLAEGDPFCNTRQILLAAEWGDYDPQDELDQYVLSILEAEETLFVERSVAWGSAPIHQKYSSCMLSSGLTVQVLQYASTVAALFKTSTSR